MATVATGTDFARTAYSADKAEVRKVITALVIAGDPLILFDNVTGKFGDASLDMALTGTRWKDRILGASQMYDGPLTAVFYASTNNCDVGSDAARRILPCRLESKEENPEDRSVFKYRLPDWARENRHQLLTAALTVLKAFDLAGRPDPTWKGKPLRPWGSFGGWSSLVRAAVVWAGMDDPAEGKDKLRQEADRDAATMRALLAELKTRDEHGKGFTAREVAKNAGGDEVVKGWEAVADLLTAIDATTAARLGYKFRHYKGRVFGGLMLTHLGGKGSAGQRWVVVPPPKNSSEQPPSSSSSPSERRGSDTSDGSSTRDAHRHTDQGCGNLHNNNDLWFDEYSNSDDGDDGSRPGETTAQGVTMGDGAAGWAEGDPLEALRR